MVQETVKKSQKERINDKYGAMCDYYANLLARCIESVRINESPQTCMRIDENHTNAQEFIIIYRNPSESIRTNKNQ